MINKALLWKEWKSNKSILFFLAGFLFLYPLCLYFGRLNIAYRIQNGETLFAVAMGFVLGLAVLGHERRHNTMDFLLSLPFSRQEIFLSKIFYSIGGIVLVNLVGYLAILAVWFSNSELQAILSINSLHIFLPLQLVAGLFTFAFTLLFATLAGSVLTAGIFTVIFAIFPISFAYILALNLHFVIDYVYGINWDWVYDCLVCITPVSLINSTDIQLHWPWIIAAALVFLALAFWLFLRNPMERNGEILVFSCLNPILKTGVSVCTALLAGGIAFLSGGLRWQILFLLLGGLGGWLLTAYLIRRCQNQS